MFNIQYDLGLDLHYDKEEKKESKLKNRLNVYKYKYAQRFKIIKYSLFILQLINVLIFWSFLYWDCISKLTSKSTESKKRI